MDKKLPPKTLVVITSYDREEMLYNLLEQLKDHKEILIFDDASTFKFKGKQQFIRFQNNYGKDGLWLKFKTIFKAIPKDYDYYIFIPDDVVLCDNFVERSVNEYKNIVDNRKVCLSLLSDVRITKPNWTNVRPINKGSVVLTQWNDLCFICENKFFNEVEIQPISFRRWRFNNLLGSGVGEQISVQLRSKKLNMYHTKESFVYHGVHLSKMNTNERQKNPLIS